MNRTPQVQLTYSFWEFKTRVNAVLGCLALAVIAIALSIFAGPAWGLIAFSLLGIIALSMGIREIVVGCKNSTGILYTPYPTNKATL